MISLFELQKNEEYIVPSTSLFVHCRPRLGTWRGWTIDRDVRGLAAQDCSKGAEQKKCMRYLLAIRYRAQRVAGIVKNRNKRAKTRLRQNSYDPGFLSAGGKSSRVASIAQ